ncbi:MAG: hypothetical protein ACR2PG_11445 [Hyphomicrobiaceae bacterium]
MPTVSVEVELEEVLDAITTEELIAELKKRNMWSSKDRQRAAKDLGPVLQSAMAGRDISDEIRDYIANQVGVYVVLAFEASLTGDKNIAIAHLDRAHEPTKAATATQKDLEHLKTWAEKRDSLE